MKVRQIKKTAKAIVKRAGLVVKSKRHLDVIGKPIFHKSGFGVHVDGIEFLYIPFKGVNYVRAARKDDIENC